MVHMVVEAKGHLSAILGCVHSLYGIGQDSRPRPTWQGDVAERLGADMALAYERSGLAESKARLFLRAWRSSRLDGISKGS